MRKVGIIGGIGPESTIEYYRSIMSLYREQSEDAEAPQILINSINLNRMLGLIAANQLQETAHYLSEEIERHS